MSSFDPSLDYEAIIARQEVATALLGPYIFGLTAQVLLIGVFLALFTAYAQSDLKHHSKKVKAVLWVVLMLILACLGVAMEEVFDTAVSQARSSDELFAGPPQSNILPVLTALTGAVCQGFLLVRAAALIPHRIGRYAFIVVTAASILLALAGATLFSGIGFLYAFEKPLPYIHYTTALALWLWTSAGVDLLISLALAFTLRARIAGFNSRTDGLLKRLIVVALRTAAYTAVISLAGAAVATAFENAHDYHTGTAGFAFWLPLPALHAISLYTTLSSRRAIAAELGQPVSLTSKPNFGTGGSGGVGAVSPQYPISAALPPPPPKEYYSFAHCMAGGCASIATSFIFTPSERIKQQMQVGSHYNNCWNALVGIVRNGGLPSLYAGWGAVLCRNVPHSIVKFYTYESLKQFMLSPNEASVHPTTLQTLVCGGLAGSTAALLTTPFDVVKTRLQTQIPGSMSQYNSVIHALQEIGKNEGLKGLYRGLTPRLVMYMSQGALFFASYEFFKSLFSLDTPQTDAPRIQYQQKTEGNPVLPSSLPAMSSPASSELRGLHS